MKFINASILATLAFSVNPAFAGPVDHKALGAAAGQANADQAAAAPADAAANQAAADPQAQADAETAAQEALDKLAQQIQDGEVAADVNGTEILESSGAALNDADLGNSLNENILQEMFLLGVCDINAQQLADFNLNVAQSINLLLQLQALQQLQTLGLVEVQDVADLLQQQLILGFAVPELEALKRGIRSIQKSSLRRKRGNLALQAQQLDLQKAQAECEALLAGDANAGDAAADDGNADDAEKDDAEKDDAKADDAAAQEDANKDDAKADDAAAEDARKNGAKADDAAAEEDANADDAANAAHDAAMAAAAHA